MWSGKLKTNNLFYKLFMSSISGTININFKKNEIVNVACRCTIFNTEIIKDYKGIYDESTNSIVIDYKNELVGILKIKEKTDFSFRGEYTVYEESKQKSKVETGTFYFNKDCDLPQLLEKAKQYKYI